jgi:hypothetical protein
MCRLECVTDGLTALDVLAEKCLMISVASELGELGPHQHLEETGIGWQRNHKPSAPAVAVERWLGADVRALEVAPVDGTLIRHHVVPARSRQSSDGRIASVGAHHDTGVKIALAPIAGHADSYNTILVFAQSDDARLHPDIGTGLNSGLGKHRIEYVAANGHPAADITGRLRPPSTKVNVLDPHVSVVDKRRACGLEAVGQAQPIEEGEGIGLEGVGGKGVAGESRLLENRNTDTLASE